MKFSAVFAIFNIFLIFILALLFFTPIYLFGTNLAFAFWQNNWFLILLPAFLLVFFDVYFLINGRLYTLLGKEDWPALVEYLEKQVFQKGRYTAKLVKLLANTYLVLPDSKAVTNLENKTALAKPSLVESNALIFGAARLLGKDIPGAVIFYKSRLDKAKPRLLPWVRWYYGFTLFLDRQYEAGLGELVSLSKESPNNVVTGISAYFLQKNAIRVFPTRGEEINEAATAAREKVRKAYPKQKDWLKVTAKLNKEIHAAIIAKYLEETGTWLYSNIV